MRYLLPVVIAGALGMPCHAQNGDRNTTTAEAAASATGGAGGAGGTGGAASATQTQNAAGGIGQGGAGGVGTGGAGGAASGNGAGNTTTTGPTTVATNTNIAAPSIPRPAASTAYAPDIPGTPRSCRLYLGGGGANVHGTGSGVVPLANDQTCLSWNRVDLMNAMNAIFPNTFSAADYLSAVCLVEGMDATRACATRQP